MGVVTGAAAAFNGGTITHPLEIDSTGSYGTDQITIKDVDTNIVFEADASGGLNVDGSHGGQGSQYFNTGDSGIHRVILGDSARLEVGNKDLTPSLYVIEKGEANDGGGVIIYGGVLGLKIKGPHAAPANAAFSNGDLAIWFDQTAGAAKLMVKAKDGSGNFVTAAIALA